jgi:TetR/AcrR family transcriptional repressor of nem operon
MRVTRDQLAAHRDEILDAAGRLFRARGVEGVTVAEVMGAAGLTHGGFYGHYRSKAELAATACRHVLAESAARWRLRAAEAADDGNDPIEAIVSAYLSVGHVQDAGTGCAIASLAGEAARVGGELAAAMTEGIDGLVEVLAQLCPLPAPQRRSAAMSALSAMVGGVLLARASTDEDRAREILLGARQMALGALRHVKP